MLRTADTDDFIYDPDAAARSRTDLRAFLILGATLAGGLAVTLWLWLRWRRQRAPAGMAGAARGEVPDAVAGGAPPAALPVQSVARVQRVAPADATPPPPQPPPVQPADAAPPSAEPPSAPLTPARRSSGKSLEKTISWDV